MKFVLSCVCRSAMPTWRSVGEVGRRRERPRWTVSLPSSKVFPPVKHENTSPVSHPPPSSPPSPEPSRVTLRNFCRSDAEPVAIDSAAASRPRRSTSASSRVYVGLELNVALAQDASHKRHHTPRDVAQVRSAVESATAARFDARERALEPTMQRVSHPGLRVALYDKGRCSTSVGRLVCE